MTGASPTVTRARWMRWAGALGSNTQLGCAIALLAGVLAVLWVQPPAPALDRTTSVLDLDIRHDVSHGEHFDTILYIYRDDRGATHTGLAYADHAPPKADMVVEFASSAPAVSRVVGLRRHEDPQSSLYLRWVALVAAVLGGLVALRRARRGDVPAELGVAGALARCVLPLAALAAITVALLVA